MALCMKLKINPPGVNKKNTSEKKIHANQKNAQLSTGPKSLQGKKNSSRNSIKHGLLVKDLVATGRGMEDQGEFDYLLAELRDHWQPEDLIVQEIAASYWRTRREYRCERGDVTCYR